MKKKKEKKKKKKKNKCEVTFDSMLQSEHEKSTREKGEILYKITKLGS